MSTTSWLILPWWWVMASYRVEKVSAVTWVSSVSGGNRGGGGDGGGEGGVGGDGGDGGGEGGGGGSGGSGEDGGSDGGGGGDGGSDGGDGGGAGEAQTSNPLRVTEPSLLQLNVSPAASITSLGPVVPLYWVPPTVSMSQHDSVSKAVAETAIGTSARTTHASLSS